MTHGRGAEEEESIPTVVEGLGESRRSSFGSGLAGRGLPSALGESSEDRSGKTGLESTFPV